MPGDALPSKINVVVLQSAQRSLANVNHSCMSQALVQPQARYALQLINWITAVVPTNSNDCCDCTGKLKLLGAQFVMVFPSSHEFL